MPEEVSALECPISIYLVPIHRKGMKRKEERETLRNLIRSGKLSGIPTDIEITHRQDGSPVFTREIGMQVSISHSDHILAVVIYPSDRRVGVDIEEKADKVAQVIHRVADEDELTLLESNQIPPIILWCAKEAVFKAYSDCINTMSDHVKLKECIPSERLLMLEIDENEGVRKSVNVHYMANLDLNIPVSNIIHNHFFCLAIALEDTDKSFIINY